MRILIGTYEICGWVSLFQREFVKLGHECDTFIKSKNFFFSSSSYTYDASRYQINIRTTSRIVTRINEAISKSYTSWFERTASNRYDLVVYIWDSILPDFEDVKRFHKKNVKLVFLFTGSDVRSFHHFSTMYNVSHWTFPDYWVKENIERKQQYVATAEKYADLIYSVPDQAGLQKRSYYHLQIPIDLTKFTFKNNRRKVPKVLHLPSDPWKKGTDVIEATIKELISEGVTVEFFTYRNVLHENIPSLLQDMDILVDEIVFHGPGVLSFEAMASGCAIATRYLETSPECFRPPVWNVNADNLKAKLFHLFNDYDLQQRLIVEGRQYVEMHNDSGKVASDVLFNLAQPRTPDMRNERNMSSASLLFIT